MNLRYLTFAHVIFAGFFLPAAITFAITGGLYTFDVRGSYNTQSVIKPLQLDPDPGLEQISVVARQLLADEFKSAVPSGKASLKKVGTSWQFEWTGARADFTLEPTGEAGNYKVGLKQVTPHRFFVQLHKAKGGWPFKIMAGGLAIGLLLLFASGVMMALAQAKLTRLLLVSLSLGTLAYVLAAWQS